MTGKGSAADFAALVWVAGALAAYLWQFQGIAGAAMAALGLN